MTKVLPSLTLANASDATLTETAAQSLKAGDVSALRGMLVAALFLRQHDGDKKAANTLHNAFLSQFTESTAANYLSKARACAMPEHFGWSVNVNQPVAEIVDGILPEFSAYWHDVRSITRKGPPAVLTAEQKAAQAAERKADKDAKAKAAAEATDKLGPPLSAAKPEQIVAAFLSLLSRKDGVANVIDTETLATVRRAIDAEIVARQADAVAAVDAHPLALAA